MSGIGWTPLTARSPGATVDITFTSQPSGGGVRFIDIFFLRRPKGGTFLVELDDRLEEVQRTESADGLGAGRLRIQAPRAVREVRLTAVGDGPLTLHGVAVERDRAGVVYDVLGRNGARADSLLGWDWERVAGPHLAWRDPKLVILAFGTNTAVDPAWSEDRYRAKLKRALALVRGGSTHRRSCLLIGPPDIGAAKHGSSWERGSTAARLSKVVETQRRVATEAGCAFFDTQAAMGGRGAMARWASARPPLAQADRVHLTREGYRWLGEHLYADIMAAYTRYRAVASVR